MLRQAGFQHLAKGDGTRIELTPDYTRGARRLYNRKAAAGSAGWILKLGVPQMAVLRTPNFNITGLQAPQR
jgi:hypothetical protein